jgi:hypothetical protein
MEQMSYNLSPSAGFAYCGVSIFPSSSASVLVILSPNSKHLLFTKHTGTGSFIESFMQIYLAWYYSLGEWTLITDLNVNKTLRVRSWVGKMKQHSCCLSSCHISHNGGVYEVCSVSGITNIRTTSKADIQMISVLQRRAVRLTPLCIFVIFRTGT